MIPKDFQTEGLYNLSTLETLRLTYEDRKPYFPAMPDIIYDDLRMYNIDYKPIEDPLYVNGSVLELYELEEQLYSADKNYYPSDNKENLWDDDLNDPFSFIPEENQELDEESHSQGYKDIFDMEVPTPVSSEPQKPPKKYLLLINNMDSIEFLTFIKVLETITLGEIKTNIRKSKHKEDILIYLYELEYTLKHILKGFSGLSVRNSYINYRIIYKPELKNRDEDAPVRDSHIFYEEMHLILSYMKIIMENLLGRTKLAIKQISIMSEASFKGYIGRRYPTVVVALYYYYLIKEGEKKPFQAYNKRRNIIKTIEEILAKDGFQYINAATFYSRFSEIGKGTANDPMKRKNYYQLFDLLSAYPKVKQVALNDFQSMYETTKNL